MRTGRTPGFDRLMVAASAPMQFRDVTVGEKLVEAEVEETREGFQVKFPRPIRQRNWWSCASRLRSFCSRRASMSF